MSTDAAAASFHFRRFVPDADLPRLVSLLTNIEAVDHAGEDISEDALRDQLTWPGHNPSLDRWVVEAPGKEDKLIAFASLWKAPTAEHADISVAVHPAWRRWGIGSELLAQILTRAQERDAAHVFIYADVSHQAANEFLRERGFWTRATYTEMHIRADVPLELPVWPAGYLVRSYNTVQHLPTLLRARNRSYVGLWGHREETEEELQSWFPGVAQDGTFLVFAPDADVVGTCRAEISEHLSMRRGKRTGYVDSPGVVPEHRNDGLYLPLLLTAMQWLRSKEPVDIDLESWGDSEKTLALYQKVGFTIIRQAAIYRCDLR